jgi:hypothetical protein
MFNGICQANCTAVKTAPEMVDCGKKFLPIDGKSPAAVVKAEKRDGNLIMSIFLFLFAYNGRIFYI